MKGKQWFPDYKHDNDIALGWTVISLEHNITEDWDFSLRYRVWCQGCHNMNGPASLMAIFKKWTGKTTPNEQDISRPGALLWDKAPVI